MKDRFREDLMKKDSGNGHERPADREVEHLAAVVEAHGLTVHVGA